MLLGIYCIGELVQKLIKKNYTLEWKNIYELLLISFITLLVIVVNPRSYQIIHYVSTIISNPPIQSFIEEWLPPSPSGIANITFFSSVIGLIVIFGYSSYKPKISEILLIIAFLWLAFTGQRSVIWFAIVAMPILARGFSQIQIKQHILQANNNLINLLITAIVFIPVILVQPWFIKHFPLPSTYLDQVFLETEDGPLLSKSTPVEAIQYLRDHPGGKIFNEMGYGSYIIWKYPDLRVFVDPRIELFPYELWKDYISISKGNNYSELLETYDVNRIILDKDIQPFLSKALNSDPTWFLEYESYFTQIWMKRDGG